MDKRLALFALASIYYVTPLYADAPNVQAESVKPVLNFQRLTLSTGGARPEVCLKFDRPLDSTATPQYADHLTLTPSLRPDVRVDDHDLCIGGLAWGARYQIALSSGVHDADGGRLAAPVHVTVSTGDRTPQLALGGGGYVLPRKTAAGVDVQTVNMDHVRVAVWRMSQASSLRLTNGSDDYPRVDLSTSAMNSWEFTRLRDSQLTKIWSGVLDVDNSRNATVTTAFPLAGLIQGQKPGLYLVTAENAATPSSRSLLAPDASQDGMGANDGSLAAHWINVSDLGLSAIRGQDGLHVFARSLATATPLSGVTVTLTAQGGDELGVVRTDKTGQAIFAPGLMRGARAETPTSVAANGPDGDFAMIRVNQSWFDLSDRGADGQPMPGEQQAELVTDRGIYRPGETVNVTALLRDHRGNALSSQPLILVLTRPDGVEARRATLPARSGGGFVTTEALTDSAPLGSWTLKAYADPTSAPIGSASFDVQDFVPQTLAVTVSADSKTFPVDGPMNVKLDGRYLYGTPAAGLHGDGTVKIVADDAPIEGLSDYSFGLNTQKVQGDEQKLTVPDADPQGHATISVHPDVPSGLTMPLKVEINAAMQDPAGRSVGQTLTLPLARTRPLIGVKTHDSGGDGDTQTVPAEIVTFGPDNKPVAVKGLAWSVVRENIVYDWIHDDGRWSFREHVLDEPVQHGATDTGADGHAALSESLPPARYRLVVTDPATGAASSREFYVGWWSAGDDKPTAPDRLVVTAKDKILPETGATSVHIDAPFAGKAQIVVATDRIESVRDVDVPKGGVDVPVKASADWPGGAYVLATLYRPLNAPARSHEPTRAVGLTYVGLDQSAHKLAVTLDAPSVIRPQGKLTVPVTVHGGAVGPIHLTLSAVDKGILGLTAWTQPDVFKALYGRRELAVDVTDTYAQLLSPTGSVGAIHEGGDEGGGPTGLGVTSTRVVSLFSGEVTPDANGRASVTLDVPDFEGALGLMATAWRDDAVGGGEAETVVRDPVFADLTLPRFLAPGDAAVSLVSLVNTDGAPGRYSVSIKADGPVVATGPHEFSADLAQGARQGFSTTLTATASGVGHMTATLRDVGGKVLLTRNWDMQVRSGHLPLTQSMLRKQAPGESYTVDPAALAAFEPGASVTVSYSGIGGVDTIGLLQSLEGFAWGDSESLASAARPLLLFRGHKQLGLETIAGGPDKRIRDAVATLLDREDAGGRIGDWRLNDGGTLPWTQIYLVDFLTRAKVAGYAVPDDALRHALDWLDTEQAQGRASEDGENARDNSVTPDTRAYALYVLARAGRLDAPALRALYDNVDTVGGHGARRLFWGGGDAAEATQADALALGHLAGGLALSSQRKSSDDVFGMAVDALGPPRVGRPGLFDWTYWAYVRDLAGLTPLAAESGNGGLAQKLADRFADLTLSPAELPDQTKTGLLETAAAMNRDVAGRSITVNGQVQPTPLQLPLAFTPNSSELQGYKVTNSGSTPLWLAVTTTGSPKEVTKPLMQGFTLTVTSRTMSGEPVDIAHLRQNDRFLVVIEGAADDHDLHHCVIADMLPAGWEIEGLAKGASNDDDSDESKDNGGFSFLGETSVTRSVSLQDDRFIAAFDLHGDRMANANKEGALKASEFRLAYIVRAVTPGHFLRPETIVQDRYRPTLTARSAAGTTDIATR
ncbi:alpha-2-macroglobulin family protein [Acetobacter sacchari]|uniref:Alpha-2-macroglobulin family protein n=1 Tax=Acetobacter sacchari TaxID=2661687 RepID=A0ABS3LX22_9PROT|nr:MG2 domain-containing protein [Acetobacter sacchari]MBO1360470.1 alpha-2-macroglobulin family protein [Acetobacter sacchari]